VKLSHYIAGIAILSMSVSAYADGSGEFAQKGETTKLPHAYAFRQVDRFDEKKMMTSIVFSTVPIDSAKAAAAPKPSWDVVTQVSEQHGHYVEIDIADNGTLDGVGFFGSGDSHTGNAEEQPVLTRHDEKHITGTLRTKDDNDGNYNLKFDLEIAASVKH
jgi:hypothetical protein